MARTLLVRGMLAGLIAGLLYAVFAYLFGEPHIDAAIAYEDQVAAAAGEESGGEAPVGRGIQATLGLAVAGLLYGTAVGGIFAIVHTGVYGRVWPLGHRATATVTAALAFVVVVVVPYVKYPPSPPASTVDGTVGLRTGAYIVLLVGSILLAIGALALGRRLVAAMGAWNATLSAAGAYVVAVAVLAFLLPVVDETPADFPVTVLYDFRVASFGGQLVFWVVLGLVFGVLAEAGARRAEVDTRDAVQG